MCDIECFDCYVFLGEKVLLCFDLGFIVFFIIVRGRVDVWCFFCFRLVNYDVLLFNFVVKVVVQEFDWMNLLVFVNDVFLMFLWFVVERGWQKFFMQIVFNDVGVVFVFGIFVGCCSEVIIYVFVCVGGYLYIEGDCV